MQDWSLMYKIIGANDIFHKFIEIFQNVLNSHAPLKNIEVKTKKENKKLLSKELRRLINEKHRVFNEWKKDPNQELFNSYKVLRNNVNRKLRKASARISQLQKNNGNLSRTKLTQRNTEKIAKLKEGHNVISDEESIANCLNNCFARLGLYKGEIIAPKLPSFNFKGNEFNFRPVTRRELYKVIDKLPTQKSAGPGYIPSWALKDRKLSIGTHLQFAINECINANTLPEILNEAYVTPIYKKGDRHNPENRPISVTPTLAKIFERLLLEQMSEHLNMNKIINKNQFGFQKQKSCLNTIIALTEKINHYVEEKDIVLTIF